MANNRVGGGREIEKEKTRKQSNTISAVNASSQSNKKAIAKPSTAVAAVPDVSAADFVKDTVLTFKSKIEDKIKGYSKESFKINRASAVVTELIAVALERAIWVSHYSAHTVKCMF